MQHISQTLSTCTPPSLGNPVAKHEGGLKPPIANHVATRIGAEVFARLIAQFGAKLLDQWAAAPGARDEWGCALADFHPAEIERGLTACRSRVFVPVLGEFLQLCRPALDPEAAWHEAAAGMAARERGEQGAWTHPAIYRAAQQMQWELRTATHATQRKRWAAILARQLAAGWGDIPPPTLRITQQTLRTGPPPDRVRADIARILTSAGRVRQPSHQPTV